MVVTCQCRFISSNKCTIWWGVDDAHGGGRERKGESVCFLRDSSVELKLLFKTESITQKKKIYQRDPEKGSGFCEGHNCAPYTSNP